MGRIVFCIQNESVPRDRRVWLEALTLAGEGHEVAVICPNDAGLSRAEVREGIEILRYPQPPGRLGYLGETLGTLLWTTILALRLARRRPIHVLHAGNPPDTYFLLALLLRPLGTRFVFDQHDLCPELAEVKWGRRRFVDASLRLLERCSYRAAALVIVPNNSYRRVALERGGVDPAHVVVVRNGPAEARRTATPAPPPPLVLTVAGVLGRHDGVGLLLEAAARVESRRPGSLRVDIIGSGEDMPRLRAAAAALGIAERVSWAGWLTGDEYSRRLHSAHIGVSPDPDDPFSRASTMMKIAEYIAGGMPAVVADLPENRVTAGEAALYFRPGDVDDLARRLEELLERPAQLSELAAKASERGPSLLWAHSADRLASSYRWLLNRGPIISGDQQVAG
jgi:glycosyltransferase involved in cell wall biosynthesis